jgi:HEPN domain-containing protein
MMAGYCSGRHSPATESRRRYTVVPRAGGWSVSVNGACTRPLPKIDSALRTADLQAQEDNTQVVWRRDRAFMLHQAVERAYACFLLVHTFYFPRSHNIKFLRSLAEDVDKRLIEAWPREQRIDKRRFETLKRAYVEARYSDQYDITVEDLDALEESVRRLRNLVEQSCRDRLAELRAAAGR